MRLCVRMRECTWVSAGIRARTSAKARARAIHPPHTLGVRETMVTAMNVACVWVSVWVRAVCICMRLCECARVSAC